MAFKDWSKKVDDEMNQDMDRDMEDVDKDVNIKGGQSEQTRDDLDDVDPDLYEETDDNL